jgi:hypothetical protein
MHDKIDIGPDERNQEATGRGLFARWLEERSAALGRPLVADDLNFIGFAPTVENRPLDVRPDVASHKIRVTFFKNYAATTKTEEELTPEELRDRIISTSAATKAKLPWLKLGKFGTKKTDQKCLRHDANVLGLTGVELDYDDEDVSFDSAVAMLQEMHLFTLIYTSPSHTEAKPRWRILAFLSKLETRNAMRIKYVARINGRMGGIIKKKESFNLSQGFYYGRALDNADANHRAVIIAGDFIDLRDDLYKFEAAGMPGGAEQNSDSDKNAFEQFGEQLGSHGFENILAELGDSPPGPPGLKGFNDVLSRAAASYVSQHKGKTFDREVLKARLRKAIDDAPKNSLRKPKDVQRYRSDKYLVDCINSAIKKFSLVAFRRAQRTAYQQGSDARPVIPIPAGDGPWLPVMKKLDEVLGASKDAKPPARDIDGYMVAARKVCIPKTHAFTEQGEPSENLPSPEQWVLSRLDQNNIGELIEQYINFVEVGKRPMHLQMPFVQHYQRRHESPLPIVSTIAVAPIVLADGAIMAPVGLDRNNGIIFEIQNEVRAILPRREDCSEHAVTAAMKFLCEEWLCDVSADLIGKATIISAALTVIERTLLPDRPAFFITAGRRGGGKTTTIAMLIMAVMGVRPAASSWSNNEEERRKAFLFGASYILWDNVERGAQISCPHIERSCTTAFYSDRKLGVSEIVATAASVIHFFTGNNISPRGDLASRSLRMELTIDRSDPENREFKHPDPISWTETHRGEILRALYAILLGNPQLTKPRHAPAKTRFKLWWRLVGSAVEHAYGLCAQRPFRPFDFEQLFLSQEETQDEDTVTLMDVLDALQGSYPDGFTSADLAEELNSESSDPMLQGLLREFLYPGAPAGFKTTARSVSKQLGRHLNNPVTANDQTLVLRATNQTTGANKNRLMYSVVRKARANAPS